MKINIHHTGWSIDWDTEDEIEGMHKGKIELHYFISINMPIAPTEQALKNTLEKYIVKILEGEDMIEDTIISVLSLSQKEMEFEHDNGKHYSVKSIFYWTKINK